MNFGEFVRLERDRRGWSLQDLEKKSGVKRSTLSKLELGRTKHTHPAHVDSLAAAFKIDPEIMHRIARGASPSPAPKQASLLPQEAELLEYFRSLPVERQQEELAFFRGLARRLPSDGSGPPAKAPTLGA